MATVDKADPAYAGQAIYTRRALKLYDAAVHGFNSPVLWRCPKTRSQRPSLPGCAAASRRLMFASRHRRLAALKRSAALQ